MHKREDFPWWGALRPNFSLLPGFFNKTTMRTKKQDTIRTAAMVAQYAESLFKAVENDMIYGGEKLSVLGNLVKLQSEIDLLKSYYPSTT